MFFYDLLLSQANQTWKLKLDDNNTLPKDIKLGSSVLKQDIYDRLPACPTNFSLDEHHLRVYHLF
jgi:hypothetical protein